MSLRVEERATLPHAAGELFAAASDPHRQLEWDAVTLRRVEMLTEGPLSVGSRVRGTFRGYGTVDYEYVAYEPGRTFAHLARLPMGTLQHTFAFEPAPAGTVVVQTAELEPNLIGRLAGPIVARILRHRFATIAAELDRYLRAGMRPTDGPAASG